MTAVAAGTILKRLNDRMSRIGSSDYGYDDEEPSAPDHSREDEWFVVYDEEWE